MPNKEPRKLISIYLTTWRRLIDIKRETGKSFDEIVKDLLDKKVIE